MHQKLSLHPVAVKFEDVVCKTPKALLGLDQKEEPAEPLGEPGDGVWGGKDVPSPAREHFQTQREPGAGRWRRVPAVSGDPCSILCSIPVTWEGMQRKLRLSALTSDSCPSLLCPERRGCPGLAQPFLSSHSRAGMGTMLPAPWRGLRGSGGEARAAEG